MDVSKESQNLIGQAQAYQQQMQSFMVQKETLNMQLMEISKAIEDLEKSKETDVYRISGPVLIKTSKADAKKDLKDKQDLIKTRLGAIDKSEKKIKDKIEDIREKLTDVAGGKKGAG